MSQNILLNEFAQNTYSLIELYQILAQFLTGPASDLHLQADSHPVFRNTNRKLECVEGQIEGVPPRVIPDQVLFQFLYRLCQGTEHFKTIHNFENHLNYIRTNYKTLALNIDQEIEELKKAKAFQLPANKWSSIAQENLSETFTFSPFDLVVTTQTQISDLFECRLRIHVFRAEPVTDLSSGLCVSIRRIWPSFPTFQELGFSKPVMHLIQEISSGKITSGLVLVVGSTGSGKSTTVGSILEYINKKLPINITLLEDPPEFQFKANQSQFRQIQIGRDVPSFDDAVRHILRQDPDIIVVGEIRDQKTANYALALAKTGHLIIGTMHSTTNAPAALVKYLQMVGDAHALSHHLHAVIAQKIVEPAQEFDDQHNPLLSVLIQEIIRPTKNPLMKEVLRSDKTAFNPSSYYAVLGYSDKPSKAVVTEESFATALKRAKEEKQITHNTYFKSLEVDEQLNTNANPIRVTGKATKSTVIQEVQRLTGVQSAIKNDPAPSTESSVSSDKSSSSPNPNLPSFLSNRS